MNQVISSSHANTMFKFGITSTRCTRHLNKEITEAPEGTEDLSLTHTVIKTVAGQGLTFQGVCEFRTSAMVKPTTNGSPIIEVMGL